LYLGNRAGERIPKPLDRSNELGMPSIVVESGPDLRDQNGQVDIRHEGIAPELFVDFAL
jgi:hypothetical protein